MTIKILLRIAAALIFIHLLGHSFGHFSWDTPMDSNLNAVIAAMKGYKTDFMGAVRSMADYYQGYSFMLMGWYIMSIALLWILSGHTQTNKKLVVSLSLIMGLSYLFFAAAEWIYFFPFASIVSFLAGISMLFASRLNK